MEDVEYSGCNELPAAPSLVKQPPTISFSIRGSSRGPLEDPLCVHLHISYLSERLLPYHMHHRSLLLWMLRASVIRLCLAFHMLHLVLAFWLLTTSLVWWDSKGTNKVDPQEGQIWKNMRLHWDSGPTFQIPVSQGFIHIICRSEEMAILKDYVEKEQSMLIYKPRC